jgi:hypothetical protein
MSTVWNLDWSEHSMLDRLFFWDLLELARSFPGRVSPDRAREANLTPRQLAQRHAFLRPGIAGGRLWPDEFGRYVSFRWPGITDGSPPPAPTPEESSTAPPSQEETRAQDGSENIAPPDIKPPTIAEPPSQATEAPAPVIAVPIQTVRSDDIPTQGVPPREEPAPTGPEPPGGLDPAQREVVYAPVAARMIVLAPPGTGKTFTLIERVRHLVQSGGVGTPSAVTVLSFTRAAVAEIVGRISGAVAAGKAGDDLRFITVRTFDSFASHVLFRDTAGNPVTSGGHEGRIREFTRRLRTGTLGGAAAEQVSAIRCLLVDEVQDLVGVRAHMVLALAKAVVSHGGGVMVFGDFAQAIYDYQEGPAGFGSTQFLAGIRETLGPSRSEIALLTDHRSTNDRVRDFVRDARAAMGPDGTNPSGSQLARLMHELGSPAGLDELRAGESRVAVLTRTNLQAYHVAAWCRGQNIPVETVRGSSASYVPGWLGRLVAGYKMEVMSLATARMRWDERVGELAGISFEHAQKQMHDAGAVDGQKVLLPRLNLAVLERRASLVARPVLPGVVAVSTIHRSKGLEFDRVFLLQRGQWQGKPDEVRVIYVAATRARACLRLLANCDREMGIRSQWFKSPVRLHHHRYDKASGRNDLFLDGLGEIDEDSLAEDMPESDATVLTRQDAVWQAFHRKAAWRANWSPEGRVLIACLDGKEIPICFVSDALETDLSGLSWAYRSRRPVLANIPVSDVATVAFPPDDRDALELFGPARVAVAPVLSGWAEVVPS